MQLFFQEFQNFGGMRFGIRDWNPVLLDSSIGSDQSGGANRPLYGFALCILPWSPSAVSSHDFDLRIRQKHKWQVELGDKLIV